MDDKHKLILSIQSIDSRIGEIKRKKERIPVETEKLRDELKLLKKAMDQDLSNLEELKENRRRLEKELEEIEIKFKKSKLKLDEVKSNKEYQAVLKEIEELKEVNYQKEEEIINLMEEMEIREKECEADNVKWEDAQRKLEKKEKEALNKLKEFDEEVQSLIRKREELVQDVDKELFRKYEALRANISAPVVAPVTDGVCQGCHLGIPPQQHNELMKEDSVQVCPHCARLIYCREEQAVTRNE